MPLPSVCSPQPPATSLAPRSGTPTPRILRHLSPRDPHNPAHDSLFPLRSQVTIEASQAPVKSVELQLVRVETVTHPDTAKSAREATEIQNIQIGDGDVCRNLVRRGWVGSGRSGTRHFAAHTHTLRLLTPLPSSLPDPRSLQVIPLYMIFPRLFTCPTMLTELFKVEFEVNLIVVFADGYMVTENFPIVLYRGR